jgi:hypothetical protein
MSDVAKKAREAMKAKARKLAGEKDQKVDSSDWSPAEPLNADVKTGMRPIGKAREYSAGGSASARRADRPRRKAGGKVMEKEIGIGMANKDMKEANEQREGKKHIGGMKHGGRTKRDFGGFLKNAATSGVLGLGGKLIGDAVKRSDDERDQSNMRNAQMAMAAGRKHGGALPQAKIHKPARAAAQHYRKGGKVSKADGGIIDTLANALAGRGYIDGSSWMDNAPAEEPRASRPMELVGAKMARPVRRAARRMDRLTPEQASREMEMAYINEQPDLRGTRVEPMLRGTRSDLPMKRGGKKVAKATGGALMGVKPKARKGGKGKTDIKINIISAGGKPGPMPMLPPDGAPGVAPVPMPPPGGAPAPMMPPAIAAPPPMPAPGPMPMGRKAGGRITKVASSYKDMEAGAASGEGRLQKTDIEKKHADAPARRAGGRAPKSYRDMTAGAESGKGRLQKTAIEKSQRARGA